MDEQIRAIQEYVYSKYIEPGDHGELDDESAARLLDEYYQREDADVSESYFPGVLWFEVGFEQEDESRKESCFLRSYFWLKRYQAISGEEWDAVDDRILDVEDWASETDTPLQLDPAPPMPDLGGAQAAPVQVPTVAVVAPHVVEEVEDHGPMMRVAGGTFLFGMEKKATHLADYFIDKFPVTNRHYEAFCRATGYRWPRYRDDERFNHPDAPVVGVSVQDAEKYARWVGKQLPSEEQWEKACRGADGRLYPWGDDEPANGRACYGKDALTGGTDPVTDHPDTSSPFGVVDMVGNVWEWTRTTAVDGGETVNLIKGGCYNDAPSLLRADIHLGQAPKDKYETIGFRCVKASV